MRNIRSEIDSRSSGPSSRRGCARRGSRTAAVLTLAVLGAASLRADPIYGPDYGPTDFALPGAFATTNFYPVPTTGAVRYVAPDVPKGSRNDGTSFASPWNLYDALNGGQAVDDTTLVLSGGVYRVANDTASSLYISKRLTLQPYLDQKVWLKGSVVIEGSAFTREGSVWHTPWTLCFTNALNQGTNTHYYIDEAVNPVADDGGMVFDRKGQPLRQVPALAELGPGRFYIDYAARRLYVGDDPEEIGPVESAACMNGLYVTSSAKRAVLRGLGVAHFANRGILVLASTGHVENCVSVWNGVYGMNMYLATGSVVRGCTFACNGSSGVGGGGLDALFERNLYAYNNVERFEMFWNAAGHKATQFACSNMVFRANVFERNYAMGLWLDCSVHNALVCDNVIRFNKAYGLHVEISHGNSVAFNTLYGNVNSDLFVLNAPLNRVYNNTLPDVLDMGLRVLDQIRENKPGATTFSDDPDSAAAGNSFNTYTNHVANNIMARGSPSGSALFSAHGTVWPGQVSFGTGDAMVTLARNNLYSRPATASAPLIAARADLTAAVTNYTDLALFRQHYPGFESGSASFEGAETLFRDAAARDYRPRAAGPAVGAAAPLPADLAARCGRASAVGYAGALAPWDEGWWRFDETSGPALDSVAGHHGTLSGPARVSGKGCGALYFDGTNDNVGVGTGLEHLNGALTVAAWVKPDRPPEGVGRVIANTFNYTAKRGWLLGNQYGSSDQLDFQFYSPAGTLATVRCNDFFKTGSNRWVHVAGVFKPAASGSDGYLALFTNGVLAAPLTPTALTAIGTTNTNLRIGMRADSPIQGMWSGLIDEVKIFGAALSPAEIQALMPVAAGRWRFDEVDGLNKAYDSVSTNTGAVVNAVYTDAGKGGRALSFNGLNSRVDVANHLAHLSNAVTVSAWVRPDRPPSAAENKGRVIASTYRWDSSAENYRGWLLGKVWGATDDLQFQIYSPAGVTASASCSNFFSSGSNRWVHVAGVFKPGAYVALYTNGVLAASNATAVTAIGTTNTNLRIGTRADNTTQGLWSGLIDEVRIYDGALSPAELAAACMSAPDCPPQVRRVTVSPSVCFQGDTVMLEADAFDPDPGDRIARVEFYVEDTLIGVSAHEPYRLLWKSQGVAGSHRVTARVYDTQESVTTAGGTVELKVLMTECAAGRWRFDETSGSYSYDSVGTACGTNYNGVSRASGRVNGALSFDGTNDCVGFGTGLPQLNGALTVSAWVKPATPPAGVGRVIANTFNYTAKRGWLLGNQYGSSDRLEFQFYSPAGSLVTATCNDFFKTWSNRWVHVAGMFKPGAWVALYTNGVLAASNATAFAAIGTTNTNLRIGMRADSPVQGMWSGLIDEVRVFGAALPQDELDALCSVPAGEWRFEEPDGHPYATNSLADLLHGTVFDPSRRTSAGSGDSRAIIFDGSTNRVNFTTNFAHLAGALTVSAWVKPASPPSGIGRVIANTFSYNAKRGWLLGNQYGSSDLLQFHVSSPTGGLVSAECGGFFKTWSNQWVHVAGVFKPGECVALYTNGTQAAWTPTAYTAIGTTNTNLRIGMRADVSGQGAWSGLIDEVRLYEGALPLFAIQALSASEPVNMPGILGVDTQPPPRRTTVLLVR